MIFCLLKLGVETREGVWGMVGCRAGDGALNWDFGIGVFKNWSRGDILII